MIQINKQPSLSSSDILEAVLLNSNFRLSLHRQAIPPRLKHRYRACVRAGGGIFKLPCGECRLDVDSRDSGTLMHLWCGQSPVAVAGVAATPLEASALWEFVNDWQAEQTCLGKLVDCSPELEQPRHAPWLAVAFSPEFLAGADPNVVRLIFALHWLLAWAIVDRTAKQQRRN